MEALNLSVRELLETLALQHAAGRSVPGGGHGSVIAKIAVGSWQVDLLRGSQEIVIVEKAEDLRKAMGDPAAATIFLPRTAMVTAEIIERICAESGLSKMVIWEEN